jgi:DNA-binding transcriptional ArsR family regulator
LVKKICFKLIVFFLLIVYLKLYKGLAQEAGKGFRMSIPKEKMPSEKSAALTVLGEIILGATTPKHLALSLGKSPPAIMKQLNLLKEMGWVKLGEKKGKFQHYEISWDRVVSFCLSKAPRLQYATHLSGEVHDLRRRLSQNERFKLLFINYMMERYRTRKALLETLGFCVVPSVPEIMENFEESLLYLLPKIKVKSKTKEDKELLTLLKKWAEFASKYAPAYRPFELALKTLGFL